MSDFKDINVDDYIRAKRGTVEVTGRVRDKGIRDNWVDLDSGVKDFPLTLFIGEGRVEWSAEIIPIPLPTKEYALIGNPSDMDWNPYILREGEWFEVRPARLKLVKPEEVQVYMREYGFEVLFEGVDPETETR